MLVRGLQEQLVVVLLLSASAAAAAVVVVLSAYDAVRFGIGLVWFGLV